MRMTRQPRSEAFSSSARCPSALEIVPEIPDGSMSLSHGRLPPEDAPREAQVAEYIRHRKE